MAQGLNQAKATPQTQAVPLKPIPMGTGHNVPVISDKQQAAFFKAQAAFLSAERSDEIHPRVPKPTAGKGQYGCPV